MRTLTPATAFLGWVALIPLFFALQGTKPRQGALLSWTFGFVQFGGILYWIGLLEAAQYLSWLGWFALVLYLSLFFLVFGWTYRKLDQDHDQGFWVAPFLWVALEYIRGSRPWGGFSWGELGYSQAPYPLVLTLTTGAGVYGLTFLMVAVQLWTARWLYLKSNSPSSSAGPHRIQRLDWWPPWAALGLLLAWGSWTMGSATFHKAGEVVLLQPSIDQEVKWSKENEEATYRRLEGLVREAQGTHPALIVWPETASPSYLTWTPSAMQRVGAIVRASGTSHLVGCLDAEKGSDPRTHSFNAALPFDPSGQPRGAYHKRHLVPFGEFVPFQKYLKFLGPVVGDLGNFEAGKSYERFQVSGFSYTPMICYEVIFPGDVFQACQTGADALVNISNDAWYGRTASACQHAMMALVRSAEERRPLLRSSNAGICLVSDPYGRILGHTKLFEPTFLRSDVLLADRPGTLYSRWGNWFPRACWAIVLLVLGWAWTRRRMERRHAS